MILQISTLRSILLPCAIALELLLVSNDGVRAQTGSGARYWMATDAMPPGTLADLTLDLAQ